MSLAGLATVVATEDAVPAEIKENSILELDLDIQMFDNVGATQELEEALGLGEPALKFYDVVSAIRKAAAEDNIKGINLKCQFPIMGWSQAQTIRKALKEFKDAGKFIYSYGDYYGQKGYYLASVSDSIFLHPMGGMEFKGLAAEVLYYKDFQEKYGFKMEVVRHGKYKSAVEPYLENEMSENNRTQIASLLQSVWNQVSEDIQASRNLSEEEINATANALSASLPEQAQAEKLIDGVIYENEYKEKLKLALGLDEDDKIKKTRLKQLTGKMDFTKKVYAIHSSNLCSGPVLYGEGSENIIGQEVFLEAIDDALKNRRVKAIVLRIDSPGGRH